MAGYVSAVVLIPSDLIDRGIPVRSPSHLIVGGKPATLAPDEKLGRTDG